MEKEKILYEIYDGRYHTDPDRAICFEVCETLKEETNQNMVMVMLL